MHVPSSGQGRQWWRTPLALRLIFVLVALAGVARAAEFDEKLQAPMMKNAAELQSQAQGLAARFAELRDAAPEQLILDPKLARRKFDLVWQIQRAIDERQPLDELASSGITSRGDGSYNIDVVGHPEWNDLHETIAGLLSRANLDTSAPALIARGFRPEDIATLKDYVAANNPDRMSAAESLPIVLGLGRAVRKYDKIKRPVPYALVASFSYQRAHAASESNRRWVEGLLNRLDAQRRRVLLSTFTEMEPTVVWSPENIAAGTADLLARVRLPDFEARATAEAKGVGP